MAYETAIAWTDSTFNIAWGCTKVDPACANCYAEAVDARMGGGPGHWGPKPIFRRLSDGYWKEPLKWDREAAKTGVRRRVFCSSMTDVFHADMPVDLQERLWALIRATPNLDWLILTKRADRISRCLPNDWGPGYENVWLGVTVGDQAGTARIGHLLSVPAKFHFLSVEPLLEPVDLYRGIFGDKYRWTGEHPDIPGMNTLAFVDGLGYGIDWVIVGGESGPNRRPMDLDWVRSLRDQCVAGGVAFFFKQVVEPNGRKIETPDLDGRKWVEYPSDGEPKP